VLDKVREARSLIEASGYAIRLEVDGGVSTENIRALAEAGADTFVSGSAIFNTADYAATIATMRAELLLAGK
jgi:ribulose-phosphate 3-epimerase